MKETKQKSLVFRILNDLLKSKSTPLLAPYKFVYRLGRPNLDNYYHTLWQMEKRGVVKVFRKNDKKFLKITKKGELQILMAKAKIGHQGKWDGKWRLIIFDIPESSRDKRNLLRSLLKSNNFYKLQASVFINPFPLNREAVDYLKQTGLVNFVRILRVDEIDDDKFLKKRFGL